MIRVRSIAWRLPGQAGGRIGFSRHGQSMNNGTRRSPAEPGGRARCAERAGSAGTQRAGYDHLPASRAAARSQHLRAVPAGRPRLPVARRPGAIARVAGALLPHRRAQVLPSLRGGRARPECPNASFRAALATGARDRGGYGGHRAGRGCGRAGSDGTQFPVERGDALAGDHRSGGRHARARWRRLDRAARAEPDAGSGSLPDTRSVPDAHTLAHADGDADGDSYADAAPADADTDATTTPAASSADPDARAADPDAGAVAPWPGADAPRWAVAAGSEVATA
jgi:hypothetical protein